MGRARVRDLGIIIGTLPTGRHNAITDVPGVRVGHTTLVYDQPRVARTGVTVIVPRDGEIFRDHAFAGFHSFNGNGEMTGTVWMEESGLLVSPIGITNTHQVGVVRDAIVEYAVSRYGHGSFLLPVVAETYDGWLNDIDAFHLTKQHVFQALDGASSGPVAEGCVGGGTGMNCHEFKAGIGTASRVVDCAGARYTVGALVQANYGTRPLLRVDGVPMGREIPTSKVPSHRDVPKDEGSIIIIVGTDAPLIPTQCKRLAQRATAGLARVGGIGGNSSGDIFMAFATGNHVPLNAAEPFALRMVPHEQMDVLFQASVEAVEESILNALAAAETMRGQKGRVSHALPLDELMAVMARYRPA
jgi:D-aminopeptidase